MTAVLSRSEELRNDLENLHFTCRYYISVLAELEQLGKTHTMDFKRIEENVRVLKANIRRVSEELEKAEENEYLNELEQRFMEEEDLHHWSNE